MIGKDVVVLQVKSPDKKERSPFRLYVLTVRYKNNSIGDIYLRVDEYEAFELERKILKYEVPFKLLEEYRNKISEITSFDESLNTEDI